MHGEPSDKEIVYGIYVRKSSESEDRQVQSLERQRAELFEHIKRHELQVYPEIFEEEQSAFSPGRDEFARLVSLTEQGKINAWLCWHFNRLSRNPVDAGRVIYLMDQGHLDHVRTREKTFWSNAGDKFILNLELSISKKDSDDKSAIVRSGIRQRNRRGLPTGRPPVGFDMVDVGVKGMSSWKVDDARFHLLQKVFRRFLLGRDSVRTITDYAGKIGLTTRPTRRQQGNHPLTISYMHRHVLANPVYAGFFFDSQRERYILAEELPRILAESEHRNIRQILERNQKGKVRKKRSATYQGLVKDREGKSLGIDVKDQVICDCRTKFSYVNRDTCPKCQTKLSRMVGPRFLRYTYYYSLQDRTDPLKVARTLEEKRLEALLRDFFSKNLPITGSLRDWSLKYLNEIQDNDLEENRRLARYFAKSRIEIEAKRTHVKELLMEGHIDSDDYERKQAEQEQRLQEIATAERRSNCAGDWSKEVESLFDIAVEFQRIIQHGDDATKKDAVSALTSNLTWDGENLSICTAKSVTALISALKLCKAVNDNFEPENIVGNIEQNVDFQRVRPTWSGQLNAFRTCFLEASIR